MTTEEWNAGSVWLENAEEGCTLEYNGRTARVENMAGGRYLLIDENGFISGQTNYEWKVMHFLNTGKTGR